MTNHSASAHSTLDSTENSYRGVQGMSEPTEWILIKDAAAIMGLHIESVRRLCRQNKIRCRQLIKGVSAWEVSKEDAENYERDYGGRPHETDL